MKHIVTLLTIVTFQFQILLAAPFLEGRYYTTDGKKVEGFIKFSRASFSVFGSKPSSIKFKASTDSKAIKLTVDDIASFVVEKDSFTIIQNFKINSVSGEYVRDFAQVIVVGQLSLYLHKSASSDGKYSYQHDRFVISDNKLYLGIWNFNKQRSQIANFFSKRPDLTEKIMNKDDETSIQLLVKDYNRQAGQ